MCFSMFSLPTTVTVSGIEYPVRTDYRVILESLPDSVFARVLRIREKLCQGKKLDKTEKQWYRRNMDLVNIRIRYSLEEERLLSDWT